MLGQQYCKLYILPFFHSYTRHLCAKKAKKDVDAESFGPNKHFETPSVKFG